ncbi:MAG: glutathione-disulfide reductase [Hyphomicrobiales bacterium]
MSVYDYDLFVIGAGSGGVRAARMAAGYGARVAVAEADRVGGTCVIRGCIPKKLFVHASRVGEEINNAEGFGWSLGETHFDWPTLVANKDREIDRLSDLYSKNLKASGVVIIEDHATLKDAHTLSLERQARTVTAAKIVIATGARPFMPEVPGIEHAITSNEAFHLERLPERIAIVGGGYIAVEFAGIFNGLGVATTLIHRGEEILRGFDDDLRGGLRQAMIVKGVDVRVESRVTHIEADGNGYHVCLADGTGLRTDLVMYATGRHPNISGLGLQAVGVECGGNGCVAVDEYMKTSLDNIYAVGDVTDRINLTPVAIREGAAVAETLFNDNPTRLDYAIIPTAVFSQPEIGTVGLGEAEARKRYDRVDIYKSTFRPLKYALSGRDERTLIKLVVDSRNDIVLGCHILGNAAGELIQLLGVALQMGATKADFDATIAVHPTTAEELVTMRRKPAP